MRKTLVTYVSTIVLLLGAAQISSAAEPRSHIRGGVEWGYTMSIWQNYHYNYLTDAYARVDSQGSDVDFNSHGHIYAYIGYEFARTWEADVIAGLAGVWTDRSVVPIDLRLTKFFPLKSGNSLKAFIEGGPIISHNGFVEEDSSYIARLGGGYRIMLTERLSLDLSVSFFNCMDHPADVVDPKYNSHIDPALLRRSDTLYQGLSFSISLNY